MGLLQQSSLEYAEVVLSDLLILLLSLMMVFSSDDVIWLISGRLVCFGSVAIELFGICGSCLIRLTDSVTVSDDVFSSKFLLFGVGGTDGKLLLLLDLSGVGVGGTVGKILGVLEREFGVTVRFLEVLGVSRCFWSSSSFCLTFSSASLYSGLVFISSLVFITSLYFGFATILPPEPKNFGFP